MVWPPVTASQASVRSIFVTVTVVCELCQHQKAPLYSGQPPCPLQTTYVVITELLPLLSLCCLLPLSAQIRFHTPWPTCCGEKASMSKPCYLLLLVALLLTSTPTWAEDATGTAETSAQARVVRYASCDSQA